MKTWNQLFTALAKWAARTTGRPTTFILAALTIIVWAVTGPIFGYNETWQLVINTGTTIITFLMIFLIQNTQNRDTAAIQIKLDELIRAMEGAHNALLDLEELEDRDLERLRNDYEDLAAEARKDLAAGKSDGEIRQMKSRQTDCDSEGRLK